MYVHAKLLNEAPYFNNSIFFKIACFYAVPRKFHLGPKIVRLTGCLFVFLQALTLVKFDLSPQNLNRLLSLCSKHNLGSNPDSRDGYKTYFFIDKKLMLHI